MPQAQLCPARTLAGAFVTVMLFLMVVAGTANAAAAPELRGVQLHSLWWDSSNADLDRELDLARDANANVVRVDVNWGSLETGGKGQYSPWYLEKLDRFVNGADARGMKVIAMVWSTPCWASSAPADVKRDCAGAWWDRGVGSYLPTNLADYGDTARFVTARYGDKLAALEVWNEPNLDNKFFLRADDPAAAYAALLKAAYPRAKAGNAEVPVLAGSLAYADRPFLDRLYAHGINGYHDGIAIHPYNEWRHPGDRWQADWKKYTLLPGTEWIRQGQQAAGDNTPIWITEFGWTTGTQSGWRVTQAQQADFVRDSFPVLAQLSYVRSAVVYNLRNKGTDAGGHEDNFGIVNRDFSPKPAYTALREALAGATTPQPPAGLPSVPPAPVPPAPPAPPVPTAPAPEVPRVPPVVPSSGPSAAPASSGSPRPSTTTTQVSAPTGSSPTGSRSVRRPRSSRKVAVRVTRRRGVALAVGRGPARSRLRLQVSGCRRASVSRVLLVKVSGTGRFARRLGSARRLAGCRVTTRIPAGGPAPASAPA